MRLYIETSVIGFWYDAREHNRKKRRSTRRLLLLCRKGVHEGFVSPIVRKEIEASREPYRGRDLRLLVRLGLSDATASPEPFSRLMEGYLKEPMLQRLPEADLEHIAVFSLSDLDGMATWNLKDLTNQVILEVVRKVNDVQGIQRELRIAPPDAFLPPEE